MRVGSQERVLREVRDVGRATDGSADEVGDPALVAVDQDPELLGVPLANLPYQSLVAPIPDDHPLSIRFL